MSRTNIPVSDAVYERLSEHKAEGDTVVDLSLPTPSDGDDVPWDDARRRAFITGYTPSNRAQRVLTALGLAD
ncbi:hypothetical protein [Haloarcula amylolytica]|uniref:Uncharacterized protein n=1 Tax=Haloarcula amylolytica JCM 13557 TaxID=1227452 RepID=M0KBG8_9EURY|nr:hypothetical protein [Haloarcula amylolytica]EMA17195.1 hypothetical protein C442_18035 [Haloarcula amylolytica JCM 13557]